MLTPDRRDRAPHPTGYNPGVPRVAQQRPGGIFGRRQVKRAAVETTRQQKRAAFRDLVGASPKALSRASRTIHTPANSAELTAILNVGGATTLTGGDVIVLPPQTDTTFALEVHLKEGLGTDAEDAVTIIVENYATNFTANNRAIKGTDDDLCAKLYAANGGDDGANIIRGGKGSYYRFYGIRFSSDIAAGTAANRGLVQIGGDWRTGSIYSSGTPQSVGASTVRLASGESVDWMNAGGTGAGANIIGLDANDVVLYRGTITGYNTGTKDATVTPTVSNTSWSSYSVTYGTIAASAQGKADFYHCVSDATNSSTGVGVLVVNLALETQGSQVHDCDFWSHGNSGDGQNQCVSSVNSYGPIDLKNNGFHDAPINVIFFSYPWLAENPNSAAGMKVRHNFFERAETEDVALNHIELKGGDGIEIYGNVFKGCWAGSGQNGQAINISTSGNEEGRWNKNHHVHHNYVYDCEQFISIGGTSGLGYDPTPTSGIVVEQCLALVGYDPRTDTASGQPAVGLSVTTNLEWAHCTIVGNHATRRLGRNPLTISGAGSMPGFNMHGVVLCEGNQGGFTFATATLESVCGTGQYTTTNNAIALMEFDAPGNCPTGNYYYGDGSAEGVGQTALDADMNTSTYQITDAAVIDDVDSELAGVDVAALLAYIDGVEAGVPTMLQTTTVANAVALMLAGD